MFAFELENSSSARVEITKTLREISLEQKGYSSLDLMERVTILRAGEIRSRGPRADRVCINILTMLHDAPSVYLVPCVGTLWTTLKIADIFGGSKHILSLLYENILEFGVY